VTGDELTVADSGDELQKGKVKFVLPLAPLLNSFLPEYFLDVALLLELFMVLGMLCSDGAIEELRRAFLVRWR
jgi:hypothetical protein